jgi:abequosyltransferase
MGSENSVELSICIPVYNCGDFLGAALDSILVQMARGVEIVIYDGGSTDDTEAVASRYLKSSQNIRYFRGAMRGGIDADMAACVGFARGKYCWLFSGDDVMRAGAIRSALKWLELGHDLYICEHTLCDKQMQIKREYPVLSPNLPFSVDLRDRASREMWFRRAVTTEAFFSFMSSLIIRRDKWCSGRLIHEFDGSCWAHVARLFELIPQGLLVTYVAEIWLDQRGGNDSFRENGIVRRYSLAIDGFDRISERFFPGKSIEAANIQRVIRYEFDLRMFLDAKLLCSENPNRESKMMLDALVRKTYRGASYKSMLSKAIYLAAPTWGLRLARSVVRHFRRYATQ